MPSSVTPASASAPGPGPADRVIGVGQPVASWTTSGYGAATTTELHTSIAESVRTVRTRRGFTLDRLADAARLSKAYLSRLESGERQPSVATLLTLSRVLEVPMSVLLGERAAISPLAIYHEDQPGHEVNGLTTSALSGFGGSRALEAVKILIQSDRTPPAFARHSGEEWIYVVSGTLRLEYDGETYLLARGESAHFDSDRLHRLGADGSTAEVLLVSAATPNDLRQTHQ